MLNWPGIALNSMFWFIMLLMFLDDNKASRTDVYASIKYRY